MFVSCKSAQASGSKSANEKAIDASEYKEKIDAYSDQGTEGGDRTAGGQAWSGRSVRAAIEAAARLLRAEGAKTSGVAGGVAMEVADGVPSEVTQSTTREAMSALPLDWNRSPSIVVSESRLREENACAPPPRPRFGGGFLWHGQDTVSLTGLRKA